MARPRHPDTARLLDLFHGLVERHRTGTLFPSGAESPANGSWPTKENAEGKALNQLIVAGATTTAGWLRSHKRKVAHASGAVNARPCRVPFLSEQAIAIGFQPIPRAERPPPLLPELIPAASWDYPGERRFFMGTKYRQTQEQVSINLNRFPISRRTGKVLSRTW